jgi:hypothetical protein
MLATAYDLWRIKRRTKGAIMPAQFPIVNCKPLAVVLLPYRGLFVGTHANGMPTATYRPSATRKQPAYLPPKDTGEIRRAYPMIENSEIACSEFGQH